MKKLFLKSILFLCILFLIIYKLDSYFVADDPVFDKYFFLHEKKKNSLDVLFVGDSHTANGINTSVIDAKCKLNSYNLGIRASNIFHAYYRLEEALMNQKPKLVIIENFTFLNTIADTTFLDTTGLLRVKNKMDIFGKKVSLNKKNEIDLVFKENKIYNLFNVFRAHENWSDLKSQSKVLYKYTSNNVRDNIYRDHYRSYAVKSQKEADIIKAKTITRKISLSKDQEEIIKKIIKLSIEHNFELVFLTLPYYEGLYPKIRNQVEDVNKKLLGIFKEYSNVRLLDLNQKTKGFSRTCFLSEKDILNNHLNYKGGVKASSLIANYINDEYNFNLEKINKSLLETYLYNENIADSLSGDLSLKFNLERINNKKGVKTTLINRGNTTLKFQGWAYLKDKVSKGNKIYIGLKKDDDFIFFVHTEAKVRKDVTKYFKKENGLYDNSGFEISFTSDLLEQGEYDIYLLSKNKEGLVKSVNTGKKIKNIYIK
ncbi:hypothetical protein [Algibacter sp. Ld11]|uniref:hypothetical protein n=1 Tax=Algibacter sp. Ld11 TaxID=649150 RepID=UPI003869A8F0